MSDIYVRDTDNIPQLVTEAYQMTDEGWQKIKIFTYSESEWVEVL